MKTLLALLFSLAFSLTAQASFEGLSSSTSLKIFNRLNCGSGLTCTRTAKGVFNMVAGSASLVGSGTQSITGFVKNRVLATATTITAAQCGSTFYNGGAVQMELPEASAVLGCRLTFITANASNFDLNPDNADQILVQTNAVGDAIRNATLGNTITLEAISASQWAVVGILGTYTDIN